MNVQCFLTFNNASQQWEAKVDQDGIKLERRDRDAREAVQKIIKGLQFNGHHGKLRVIKAQDDFLTGQPAPPAHKLTHVVEMMHNALDHLQFPKIRLETSDGGEIQLHIGGERSKYQGQIMITDGQRYPDNKWYGRIDRDGTLHKAKLITDEIIELLCNLDAEPEETISSYGRSTGNCSCCGRLLTNPESVARGIGPICAGRFGL